MNKINTKNLVWMYQTMKTSRYFGEKLGSVYHQPDEHLISFNENQATIESTPSNGRESAAAGMIVHLTKNDVVYATEQPYHHAIAKKLDISKLITEMYCKHLAFDNAKNGRMFYDTDVNFSCGGAAPAGIEHAVDMALDNKKKKTQDVVVVFIDEAATNSGAFNESLNLAVLWKLPIIVVVEDSGWGVPVAEKYSTAVPSIVLRATAHGIKGFLIKDNDPLEMYRVSEEAVLRARNGKGPSIIDIKTYRDHSLNGLYSDHGEISDLRAKDSVKRLRNYLLLEDLVDYSELDRIDSEIYAEVDQAYELAIQSEYCHA